jgi:hypothetical protein
LQTGTALTDATHQPDQFSPVVLELLVSLHSRVGVGGCWFLLMVLTKKFHRQNLGFERNI